MPDPQQAMLLVLPAIDVVTLARVVRWARDTGAFSDLATEELTRLSDALKAVVDDE